MIKSIINKLKTDDNIYKYSILIFLCIQPILELDLYLQAFYIKTGLLAFSTIIRIIGLVWLGILALIRSKHIIRDTILWSIYGIILIIYTYFHFIVARGVDILLPPTYVWVKSYEIKYILFLILPYVLLWATSKIYIEKKLINTTVIFISLFICTNIFITNILVSSYGSYGGITYQNIFTWFIGIYDSYTPKELTSMGFYFFSNPLSGSLIVIYPLVVKAYLEEKTKLSLTAIIIQTLAMFMIGTRVGAYGIIIVLVAMLLVYLFLILIKYQKEICKKFIILLVVLASLSIVILPFSPAYRNASFDYDDELSFDDNERLLAAGLLALKDIKDPDEYHYALIYQLEHIYIYYITFPREYYEYYYSYKFDPEFYFDVLSLPFEQRKGGRQFEKYFINRKYNDLTDEQKLFGLGYSRMSQGGIVLEQDFLNQYYLLGPIGACITVVPYLILFVYLSILLLLRIRKKEYFTFENLMLYMSFSLGLIISYYSGHILDEPIASFYLAFIGGRALFSLKNKEVNNGRD